MKFQFAVPKIICASGASKNVGDLALAAGCKKILCIYDKGVKSAGIVDPILTAMREAGLSVSEFDHVMPDPAVDLVEQAGQAARDCGAGGIVAIGGGSAIDTAKLAAALAANHAPLQTFYGQNLFVNSPLPLFAIPTTSGTGSEVTPAAVVSDPALGRKVTLVDAKLIPVCAVLDPLLTLGLPGSLTAATGMDALSHAIESMTCIMHNPMTDGIALSAVGMIAKHLPQCVAHGDDEEARAGMMAASTMAGMAFGNTAAHVGHAFAHAMGAKWHIPHGIACALALPFAVENCASAAPDQVAAIAGAVGVDDAAKLPQWLAGFAASIGIPTLKTLNIDPAGLDGIVTATLEEKPLILLSGVPVTPEACRSFYEKLFRQ